MPNILDQYQSPHSQNTNIFHTHMRKHTNGSMVRIMILKNYTEQSQAPCKLRLEIV